MGAKSASGWSPIVHARILLLGRMGWIDEHPTGHVVDEIYFVAERLGTEDWRCPAPRMEWHVNGKRGRLAGCRLAPVERHCWSDSRPDLGRVRSRTASPAGVVQWQNISFPS
jgi:hypothetical protein